MRIAFKTAALKSSQVALLILAQGAYAQDSTAKNLEYTDSQQQPIKETQIRRKHWSLSEEEWSRYQVLMLGIRGSISPANISPIEVLGTHARSEQEREQYAEIWARMRHEDAERILAFQEAFRAAVQKLYPNEPLIDPQRMKSKHLAQTEIGQGDRILAFIKIRQCPECGRLIQKLIQHPVLKTHQIDLYFIDTRPKTDDAQIRQWAQAQGIDRQRLKNGSLTLNHDNGNYYKLTRQVAGPIPQVFKLKGQTLAPLLL